ncbi:MAG: hypothetical protein IJS66_02055 [Bacteroidales bacterium]|nr:hypothetical protein [Bacteroidales bacterium]
MKRLLFFATIIAALVSCKRSGEESGKALMTFTAVSESGVRTSLSDGKVFWSEGDAITVFSSSCKRGETYGMNASDAGKAEAAFGGPSVGAAPYYAFYPDGSAAFDGTKISFTLPSSQTYSDAGFATGVNPMAACSEGETLEFKNLAGLLTIPVSGNYTIISASITSNSEEALWGEGEYAASFADVPSPSMVATGDAAHRTLSLDCGEGVALGGSVRSFCFVLPVGTLSKGFTLRLTDADGGEMVKTTESDALTTLRSSSKRMAAVEYLPTDSPFLRESVPGVYDLSAPSVPAAVRVYNAPTDQLALRILDNSLNFRIQSLSGAYALRIGFTRPSAAGESCTLAISSIGETGVADGSVSAKVLKVSDGKAWLTGGSNLGFIIPLSL